MSPALSSCDMPVSKTIIPVLMEFTLQENSEPANKYKLGSMLEVDPNALKKKIEQEKDFKRIQIKNK